MASSCSSSQFSAQKKRALELLEQRELRSAQSELENIHAMQHVTGKRIRNGHQNSPSNKKLKKLHEKQQLTEKRFSHEHQKTPSKQEQKDPASSPASNPSTTPQRVSSVIPRRKVYIQTDGPAYSEICMANENLVQAISQESTREEMVHTVVDDIIKKGEEGHKFAKRSESLQTDYVVLLDNYVGEEKESADSKVKALMKHSKRSSKHMSMKQHQKYGSLSFPKRFHNFELFKPMHEMWLSYVGELIKVVRKQHVSNCFMKADRHGAFVSVLECKLAAFKGVTGIMIRETTATMGIISPDNRFRVVPKVGSVFVMIAGCWKITLIGDKLSPNVAAKENQLQQKLKQLLSK